MGFFAAVHIYSSSKLPADDLASYFTKEIELSAENPCSLTTTPVNLRVHARNTLPPSGPYGYLFLVPMKTKCDIYLIIVPLF